MLKAIALRERSGFTRVDLLITVVVIVLGSGVLLGSVADVHARADRVASENNLKQLGLATINCSDTNAGKLPPALGNFYPVDRPTPNNGYGPCLFHILPYVEQDNFYRSSLVNTGGLPTYAAWNMAGNTVKTYIAPGDPTADSPADRTSYLANGLALPGSGARYPAWFSDGTSNTILYAEAYSRAIDTFAQGGRTVVAPVERRWWDDPTWVPIHTGVAFQAAPVKEAASANLLHGFAPGGIVVSLADGSTRFVSASVTWSTFHAACTPNAGDVLGKDW